MSVFDNRMLEAVKRKQYISEYIIYPQQSNNINNYQVLLKNVPSYSSEDVILIHNKKVLPHWVQSKGNVWTKIPILLARTPIRIYALTGNPGSVINSNGENVFEFFDDFTGTAINTTKWTITNSTGWTVGGSELKSTSSTGRLRSVPTFSAPIIEEVKFKPITQTINGFISGGWFDFASNGAGLLEHPAAAFAYTQNNGVYTAVNSDICPDSIYSKMKFSAFSTTVNINVIRLDTSVQTYDNNITNTVLGETLALGGNVGAQACDMRWDWIFVRKYASPEPIIKRIKTINKSLLLNLLI